MQAENIEGLRNRFMKRLNGLRLSAVHIYLLSLFLDMLTTYINIGVNLGNPFHISGEMNLLVKLLHPFLGPYSAFIIVCVSPVLLYFLIRAGLTNVYITASFASLHFAGFLTHSAPKYSTTFVAISGALTFLAVLDKWLEKRLAGRLT